MSFRIHCDSHRSSTSSWHTGVWAVLKKHIFYWWSLSVRADSIPRLGTDARHWAIDMIQVGIPQYDVALRFGVHRNIISSLWRSFQTTVSGSNRQRSGRPRVKSQRQDQYIRVTHLCNCFQTASVTAGTILGLRRIHPRTMRNRFLEHHFLSPLPPVDPAYARFCCHAIVLNVYSGHVPIWGGVWENGKLYCSQKNFDLVWIIQMVGLWCTAGRVSATKMHAFDRDVRLAVGVWWCGVASQPMAGHPWSLLMAIWMHTTTWRRLLDRTCCPSSVVREGTWPFGRTMLDHTLRVSSWIFSDMRMCWWWLGPRCAPISRQSSTCGTKWIDGWDNDQISPSRCKGLANPCMKSGKKSHKHSMPT